MIRWRAVYGETCMHGSEASAWETYHCQRWQGAGCLAYGQIASAKIPLTRMISPQLYWVMTGNDFSLDINNPQEPKILCVGNNPDRQNIYSAALGLYNSRIVSSLTKRGSSRARSSSTNFPPSISGDSTT